MRVTGISSERGTGAVASHSWCRREGSGCGPLVTTDLNGDEWPPVDSFIRVRGVNATWVVIVTVRPLSLEGC